MQTPTPYAIPPRRCDVRGKVRTVGLEVELGKLSLEQTLAIVREVLGGEVVIKSRTEGAVCGTEFGTFKVEWDHSLLRSRSYLRPLERLGLLDHDDTKTAGQIEDSVLSLAAEFVPIEVVTPPIPCDRLMALDGLWRALREAGAEDTQDSLLYAFGLHLNPALPDDETSTLLAFVRAFLLLEDWLVEVSHLDLARRLSPFIRPFPEAYRRKILHADYAATATQLLDDYLAYNPTRNRTLDLLPLFVHLHGEGFLARVEEAPLVKGRPTFHYRLPNCELATPSWTPAVDWNRWLVVERLADDPRQLGELSRAYLQTPDLPLRLQRTGWVASLRERLALPP